MDLALVDGDLPEINRLIDGIELLVQRMTIRLNTALGEWILDRTQGLDYLAFTAQRPIDIELIGVLVRAEIESTPGVDRVDDFLATLDSTGDGLGRLTFEGRVIVTEGTDAETDLIGISVEVSPAAGDSHPAVVTYHRIGLIAPHAPVYGGIR